IKSNANQGNQCCSSSSIASIKNGIYSKRKLRTPNQTSNQASCLSDQLINGTNTSAVNHSLHHNYDYGYKLHHQLCQPSFSCQPSIQSHSQSLLQPKAAATAASNQASDTSRA